MGREVRIMLEHLAFIEMGKMERAFSEMGKTVAAADLGVGTQKIIFL